jgi:hypothetical protein
LSADARKAIYLCGGLGNQLFQLGFGLSKLDPGDELECFYDESITRTLQDNLPEISVYNFGSRVIFKKTQPSKLRQKIVNFGIRVSTGNSVLTGDKRVSRIGRIVIENLLGLALRTNLKVSVADNIGYSDKSKIGKKEFFIGYSQSFLYGEELKKNENLARIKLNAISVKAEKLISKSRNEKPIVIHVRLGDYTEEPNFGLLSPSYFLEALKLPELQGPKRQVWIFSNDPGRAWNLLNASSDARFFLVDDQGLTSSEVLEVMRNGSAYILSNSTFGWWGAFLSHTANAPVVVPKNWFKKYPTPSRIYPPAWMIFAPQKELFHE